MRRALRYLATLVAAVALATALGTLVPRPLWPAAAAGEGTRHILVLKNPIHTDIAIPLDDGVRRRFAFLADAGLPTDAPNARYIVFGWGGRAFYLETPTWSELKTVPVVKALTLDASVMHVDVAGAIKEPHSDVAGFDVDEQHFSALLDYIAASFQQGTGGPVAIEDAGYSTYDRFYEANGHFNALVGCNTWTAAGLRVAGLRTGWWNPLPMSLWWSMGLYD
ncbi:TIGR02117 family protein [Mesorhizobium sp. M2D.F.Ca.ET.185.01.1.1]|uniref:TIGR02117 family protein n=3 Tax=Mesorhizobium TaxID=68287 RepID=UPI000FCB549A|nr:MULTISPECIES: TIGR02117 family protein [unclassified Mesorhizobium]TGP78874.1 TIGR02117 family protein [bacterium M00.F.Ca.ET.227.01.1.1]TGP89598.1 TIGR02117 family protein [bacterium M00.F.Ca.ET.221.01.1.1]TGP94965.1 TIGR02117 family protein [bacterium M00.F.Ca.ET.222.01.1.1]TGU02465.1 TIGR02117 family protein [bacterium M00.F.Ca.ET.163.01.1.1]TGU19033.1 TIGR02117 family protein [bacterium M00.F.Ca.ET.156.01.1.1]TGU45954.1 TIGR02117 family protein [bacterium M00.F.Ca.ET.146.01.1.1]TGV685